MGSINRAIQSLVILFCCTMSSKADISANFLSGWCLPGNDRPSLWKTSKPAYDLITKDLQPVRNITLGELIRNTVNFPITFPIDTVKSSVLQNYIPRDKLETFANSAYPVIHEKVLELCAKFILDKAGTGGSVIENEIYKNMSISELIDRLLLKRAVTFLNPSDQYLLLNGTSGFGMWEKIGTTDEQPPLTIDNCISYDEIKLSAFLSVTSFTHFLNDGNRRNEGVYSTNRTNIEDEGIIVGMIGPRFEKKYVMDSQEILRFKTQDTTKNKLVFDIYNEQNYTYEEIASNDNVRQNRYTTLPNNRYFDDIIYRKRIALSFDTLMHEANQRAKEKNTSAYVHLVGLGLGVWKLSPHQNNIFMETCYQRLRDLGSYLNSVSDICFAYIRFDGNKFNNGDFIEIPHHPNNGIKVHIFNREPHTKLAGVDSGKLLVVSYAWDGNALPGNEFWLNSLSGSGDPAAACSTQVAELHNAHINTKVRGDNLHVVTPKGVVTFKEYREAVIKEGYPENK